MRHRWQPGAVDPANVVRRYCARCGALWVSYPADGRTRGADTANRPWDVGRQNVFFAAVEAGGGETRGEPPCARARA